MSHRHQLGQQRQLCLQAPADYTLSRLLTLSAYYDRQTNTPLLASSSYPTTTQDFGLSLPRSRADGTVW